MTEELPGVVKVSDWSALRKAVFYDTDYPASWVRNSAELARYFIDKGGYTPLNAYQLREWMCAQVAGGAEGSVRFFSQDVAPDTVARAEDAWDTSPVSQDFMARNPDKPSQACLLLAYLRAGGRLVWVGDIPLYYLGRRGGGCEIWGAKAQRKVLGLESIWDVKAEVRVTDAGREWGLTSPDVPSRCVPAGDVTAALTRAGEYAVSFFKNYNPNFSCSGFLRLREFMPPADLLRAAGYGIEEEEAEELQAPGPAREIPAGGGVLVSSGTFLVDRGRALDKLMRYQLPDPETCLLPVVRCALAGKASRVALNEVRGGLEAVFDGKPLGMEELRDPYRSLFESRSASNAGARHLATGLLSALRLDPLLITVTSGPAGRRARLRIEGLGKETVQPSQDPGTGTTVRMLWRGAASALKVKRLLSRVSARCALSPVPVLVNGADQARGRAADEAPGVYFEDGRLNGFLTVPKWPSGVSRLAASVHNVLLDNPLVVKLPALQVSGSLNNDDFTLNASQSGVVNNSRCRKALAAVAARVPELLEAAARRQRETLPTVGRLMLRGGLHKHWKKWLEAGQPWEPGLLDSLLKGLKNVVLAVSAEEKARVESAERRIRACARVTLWVRDACSRLLDDQANDAKDPLLKTLWETPAYVTTTGEARSLDQVRAQKHTLGFVPYSLVPYPDAVLPFDVIWCISPVELGSLRRWETTDLTARIPRYAVNREAAEEFLGRAGTRLLASRHGLTITPPDVKTPKEMQPVYISLSSVKNPEPPAPEEPAPAPQLPSAPPAPKAADPEPPKPKAARGPRLPLPTGEQLASDPAAYFPEFLARLAGRVNAAGARLLAKFIKEEAAGGRWVKKPLVADVLASGLPPPRQAEYLLSVFYTAFNRREVKLSDSDDMDFQRALTATIMNGEK